MSKGNRSILISSHISSDLEGLCDDIYMIDGGQIVLHEDTNVLLDEYGVLKVTEAQYEALDKAYVMNKKKESFGYAVLTREKQFYMENTEIPKEILTEFEPSDSDVISKWLSGIKGSKVTVSTPVRGDKRKLVQMVHKNAEISCDNYRITNLNFSASKNKAIVELTKKLNLSDVPRRIESFDISNISGSDNVASMVVFIDGKPSKKDYRYFKIKSFEGANDYLAMQEVIYRRFRHALEEQEKIDSGEISLEECKFLPLPDLILLDGGKGHLSSVKEILDAIDADVSVYGMVKDNKHRTRALVSEDGEVEISLLESVFKFITQIQDEVHRSAIGYHRKLRNKNLEKSQLDEINGVGKTRKTKLLSHYKTIENIKNADLDDLSKVVDSKTAQNIYDFFRK